MWKAITRLTRTALHHRAPALALALGLAAAAAPAQAALVQSDFATPNDGRLITDTLTHLEYLSPFVTRGRSVNQILGGHGGLLTTEGFRYAGAATVQGMIDTYFPGTTTTHPGTVPGFAVATAFMNLFGLNEFVICNNGFSPCPRTQGYAIDGATATGLGMLTFGSTGYQILHTNPVSTLAAITDGQMGHWLIRDAEVEASAAPEPGTIAILGSGLAGLVAYRRRSKPAAAGV